MRRLPPTHPTDVPAIGSYRKLFDRTRDADPVTADLAGKALADEIGDKDDLQRLQGGRPNR